MSYRSSVRCIECGSKTETRRSMISGGQMRIDHVCRNCNIAWYLGMDGSYHIRLSTTNILASKLEDDKFEQMIGITKKHSQPALA
ncbi:MAG: hypothetical protein ACE5J5_05020 [Candidatus Hydrothermarchaeales archaeon]